MAMHDSRPIGVFDSGVGGLTVVRALTEALPGERLVYLGDTARVPYGTKSPEVVTRYALQNARFLLRREIKLLVVACNTASAMALSALGTLEVPVLGVIGPGAKAAALATRSGKVGVIATDGTLRSGAYQKALLEARADLRVEAKACPLFVPLAEEGWLEGDVPTKVARSYLSELVERDVDTLVLGCTHYPLLKKVIGEVMGPAVRLVDSAEATARVVAERLEQDGLSSANEAGPEHAYFVTDVPERFCEVGARFLGAPIRHAEQVDLTG